ncbi:MAG: PfkB family carbohydrate kinase, partial [Smithella sp.]
DEIDLNIINRFKDACIVIGIQGWLRDIGPNGKIIPRDYEKKFGQKVKAIVYSELDHPQSEVLAHRLLDTAEIVVITRSERGVTVLNNGRCVNLPAISAVEVDPTGAGDVFGIVLGLGLSAGLDPIDAANRAIGAASRVVEGPGIGRLMEVASSVLQSY